MQKSKILKWEWKDFLYIFLGSLLCAIAMNFFIIPNSLYSGGVLGISQLICKVADSYFHFSFSFNLVGVINFILNIPLFIIAYKFVSKTFCFRTLYCVGLLTLFYTIIPVLDVSVVPEILTAVLIGAILAGFGSGFILSTGGSGGGTDIIGFAVSMRHKDFSVGKISRSINVFIYAICGILYGFPIMIYSIIYSFVATLVLDHRHTQNVCSYVMIFTKEKPDKIIEFIKNELGRNCTYWEAYGGFDQSKTYISYSAMSKYEMEQLQRQIQTLSPSAFLVKSDGVGIDGNFQKKFIL